MNTTIVEDSSSFNLSVLTLLALVRLSSMTNIFLSTPLNGYVIWLILGASRDKMALDFFSLNLALSEMLYALSGVWFVLLFYLHLQISQQIFIFSQGLLYTARPLFQCCICVEYYMGVIHPVLYLRFKPLRYRVACCCVLWFFILLSCMYQAYTVMEFLYLYGYFIQNFLFLFVMLFCCLSVLQALKRPGPGDGETGKRTSNAMKRKAFKTILIITTFMTINFALYMTAVPLQCCLPSFEFYRFYSSLLNITLTTGFIQPILYLHRSGKIPSLCKVKCSQSS